VYLLSDSHDVEPRNVAKNIWLACITNKEHAMRTPTILAAAIIALSASPLAAQEVGEAIGPGPQGSEPGYHPYEGGYYPSYRAEDFWRRRVAGGVVRGAIGTAGVVASAPFRALAGNDAFAMAPGASACAQRYRSYDPATGT
jgi:hypothetical protein